jgi:hypothetical protein
MEREFSWGRVAADMLALYERLVAEGGENTIRGRSRS